MSDIFKFQTAADQPALARYLAALAEGVAAGALPLAEGHMSFTVRPRGLTDLAVKVRRKQGRTKVSLEMAWFEEPPVPAPVSSLEGR